MARKAPNRAFIRDLIGQNVERRKNEAPNTGTTRLLGIVVGKYQSGKGNDVITLDDGTATIHLGILPTMVARCGVVVGDTVDCIVRPSNPKDFSVEQIVIVNDPHAEILRWLEIIKRPKQQSDWPGFPHKADFSSDDLFQVILSKCPLTRQRRKSQKGLSIRFLSSGLNMTESKVQELMNELHESGQVYQDENGLYLPL